jgi:hypothetical protein
VRLQLTITMRRTLLVLAVLVAAPLPAAADDRVDLTTTLYQERRQGGQGGLTVVHPQLSLGTDLGEVFSLDVGYNADIVTGATASVYSVDAVSSATPFDDIRHEASLGFGLKGRRSSLSLGVSAGFERDYTSLTISGAGSIDLPGKNTTLSLSYAHNMDETCDKGNSEATILERRPLVGADPCKKSFIFGEDTLDPTTMELLTTWRELTIDTVQFTVTQNLAPTVNMQVSGFGSVLKGFQSNPYRRVRVGSNEPQEHIPDVRARMSFSLRLNKFLVKLRSAAHFDARFYSDTWGVNAGTLELGYSQYVGSSLLVDIRARVHQQSAASFFKDAFFYQTTSSAGEYFTGDRELAPVRNVVLGGKLAVLTIAEDDKKVLGLFEKLQFNVRGDIFLLDELAADSDAQNQLGRGSQFLTSSQFIDAFVLSVGVLADY